METGGFSSDYWWTHSLFHREVGHYYGKREAYKGFMVIFGRANARLELEFYQVIKVVNITVNGDSA